MMKSVRAVYYGTLNKHRQLHDAIGEAVECVYAGLENAKRKSQERAEACNEKAFVHYTDFSNSQTKCFDLNTKNIEYSEQFFFTDYVNNNPNGCSLWEEAKRMLPGMGLADVLIEFIAYRVGSGTTFAVDLKPMYSDTSPRRAQ